MIRWKVPAREGFPPLTFTWANGQGGATQPEWDRMVDCRGKKFKAWACGGLIVGSKGRMEDNAEAHAPANSMTQDRVISMLLPT